MNILLALLLCVPAQAGLQLGLGKAAAHSAGKTVDKAVAQDSACGQHKTHTSGTVALLASPLDPANVVYIQALGNLNPPGHTFPSDHIYFYYKDPGSLTNHCAVACPVYAPADGYVSFIMSGVEAGAQQYKMTITHTDTFQTYYDHMMSVDASITDKTGPIPVGNTCAWVRVSAGQRVGTTGGVVGEMALDLGVNNYQMNLPFINPSHYGNSVNADAPLKFYTNALQTTLYGLVDRVGADYLGVVEKDGFACFDVAGTLQGNWLAQDGDANWLNPDAWDQQLAFVYDPKYANSMRVSFGGKAGAAAFGPNGGPGVWMVHALATAFANVNAGTGAYGYQVWGWDPNNGNRTGGVQLGLLMVQLLDANTLKIEWFQGSLAASSPFDAGAKIYTR